MVGISDQPNSGIRIDNFTIQAKLDSSQGRQKSQPASGGGEQGLDVDEVVSRCMELLEQRLEWHAER